MDVKSKVVASLRLVDVSYEDRNKTLVRSCQDVVATCGILGKRMHSQKLTDAPKRGSDRARGSLAVTILRRHFE